MVAVAERSPRTRLYHQVRSAHLERAAELPAATIVFGGRRYDFDERLTNGLRLVQASGLRAAGYLLRHPTDCLEVNEPLMLPAARSTAAALLGVRLGDLVRRRRTRVVSYAIENLPPDRQRVPQSRRQRLGLALDLRLVRLIWGQLDRVVYGTSSAQQLYRATLPAARSRPEQTLIWALPRPERRPDAPAKSAGQVLFLGSFADRKGLPVLLEAWPEVCRRRPEARLVLCGTGPLLEAARAAAAADPTVRLEVDPPRARIRALLDASSVLVLPSQPSGSWREQVGLPIVEGLSYGCTVVTTAETGLAGWLAEHGHGVVGDPHSAAELAATTARAVEAPRDPAAVLADLPRHDGRLAADGWLFR